MQALVAILQGPRAKQGAACWASSHCLVCVRRLPPAPGLSQPLLLPPAGWRASSSSSPPSGSSSLSSGWRPSASGSSCATPTRTGPSTTGGSGGFSLTQATCSTSSSGDTCWLQPPRHPSHAGPAVRSAPSAAAGEDEPPAGPREGWSSEMRIPAQGAPAQPGTTLNPGHHGATLISLPGPGARTRAQLLECGRGRWTLSPTPTLRNMDPEPGAWVLLPFVGLYGARCWGRQEGVSQPLTAGGRGGEEKASVHISAGPCTVRAASGLLSVLL